MNGNYLYGTGQQILSWAAESKNDKEIVQQCTMTHNYINQIYLVKFITSVMTPVFS